MKKKARSVKRENRHSELTAVALDLFAQRGFSGISIKDIAKKAGVNPALIYYYYKDKADLFRAAIAQAVSVAHQQYLLLRLRNDDPMGRIHAWLESNVVLAQRIRSLVKIMLDYSSAGMRNRGIDTAIREFYELERMILVESIRRGISEGAFAPTDAERLAAMISVYLDGVMVASSIREVFDMDEAIGNVKGLLMRYLQPVDLAATRTKTDPVGGKRKVAVLERKSVKRRA
jgi:AcrR family transcriptional regulator